MGRNQRVYKFTNLSKWMKLYPCCNPINFYEWNIQWPKEPRDGGATFIYSDLGAKNRRYDVVCGHTNAETTVWWVTYLCYRKLRLNDGHKKPRVRRFFMTDEWPKFKNIAWINSYRSLRGGACGQNSMETLSTTFQDPIEFWTFYEDLPPPPPPNKN